MIYRVWRVWDTVAWSMFITPFLAGGVAFLVRGNAWQRTAGMAVVLVAVGIAAVHYVLRWRRSRAITCNLLGSVPLWLQPHAQQRWGRQEQQLCLEALRMEQLKWESYAEANKLDWRAVENVYEAACTGITVADDLLEPIGAGVRLSGVTDVGHISVAWPPTQQFDFVLRALKHELAHLMLAAAHHGVDQERDHAILTKVRGELM